MKGDLKQTFMMVSAKEYMEDLIYTMKLIGGGRKLNIGRTYEGFDSMAYEVIQTSGGVLAELSFHEYMRFIDMGVGRGHPLGGLKATRQTLLSSNKTGMVQVKDNTRKPKKFYSKPAYGKLNWLENRLLYGLTEETIATLKNEMQ